MVVCWNIFPSVSYTQKRTCMASPVVVYSGPIRCRQASSERRSTALAAEILICLSGGSDWTRTRGPGEAGDAAFILVNSDRYGVFGTHSGRTVSGCEGPVRKKRVLEHTPDIVEVYLRADKNLDRQTAEALSQLFRNTYENYMKSVKKG